MGVRFFIGEGVVGEMDGWVYFGLDCYFSGRRKKKNKNHILLFAPAAP